MKAIHNNGGGMMQFLITVFNTSKIQNESNSQHPLQIPLYSSDCV